MRTLFQLCARAMASRAVAEAAPTVAERETCTTGDVIAEYPPAPSEDVPSYDDDAWSRTPVYVETANPHAVGRKALAAIHERSGGITEHISCIKGAIERAVLSHIETSEEYAECAHCKTRLPAVMATWYDHENCVLCVRASNISVWRVGSECVYCPPCVEDLGLFDAWCRRDGEMRKRGREEEEEEEHENVKKSRDVHF